MIEAGHAVVWSSAADLGMRAVDEEGLLRTIETCCARDVELSPPAPAVRVRHLTRDGEHFYLLFNEQREPVQTKLTVFAGGKAAWMDTATAERTDITETPIGLTLGPHGVALLHVTPH
jgi:hypothetical protein